MSTFKFGGPNSINELTDVQITSIENSQVLSFDGLNNKWKNGAKGIAEYEFIKIDSYSNPPETYGKLVTHTANSFQHIVYTPSGFSGSGYDSSKIYGLFISCKLEYSLNGWCFKSIQYEFDPSSSGYWIILSNDGLGTVNFIYERTAFIPLIGSQTTFPFMLQNNDILSRINGSVTLEVLGAWQET
jgi:hypothetical protein